MKREAGATWDQLETLFSIVLCIDDAGLVVHASPVLEKFMPGLRGRSVFDAFSFARPAGADTVDALREHLSSLFLMVAADNSFAIRGQVIDTSRAGAEVLCFCGSPWLAWINGKRPDLALGLDDFSAQDAQLDQLFMMNTEQRMVEDLEELAADLREAKRRAERAQRAKESLFARMSHEMRTPLNGIVSALTLIEDGELTDKTRRLMGFAERSAANLMEVVNYVLDTSKLAEDAGEQSAAPLSLSQLTADVTDIQRPRAEAKGLSLVLAVEGDPEDRRLGAEDSLRQVLLNLLSNAIKFTEEGQVTLSVQPLEDDASGSQLRFTVSDTGIGIAPDERANIFEPFWSDSRGDPTREGTGLGLDIVRRNVEAMGGKLSLSSSPGAGSTFWLDLPMPALPAAEDPSETQTPAEQHGAKGTAAALFSGLVLLVDDNQTNLELGQLILESLGCDVDCAASGEEAIELVAGDHHDLVLMDINMPGMDGIEACRRIRESHDRDALPIVALTAYAGGDERDRALDAGMNGYLTKPIERELLRSGLAEFLPLRTADAQLSLEKKVHEESSYPVFSGEPVKTMAQSLGGENTRRLTRTFEGEAAKRLADLKKAVAEDDRDRVQLEAHSLASNCLSFGLMLAGERLRAIERLVEGGEMVEEEAFREAVSAFDQGLESLQALLTTLPSSPPSWR